MPPDYVEWKAAVGTLMLLELRKQKLKPFTGRVWVTAAFSKDRFTITIEDAKMEGYRFGQSDIDNLAGGVLDAAQEAGIIDNDHDVVNLLAAFVEDKEENT